MKFLCLSLFQGLEVGPCNRILVAWLIIRCYLTIKPYVIVYAHFWAYIKVSRKGKKQLDLFYFH